MNFIGTTGWSIPRTSAAQFPGTGTQLQRYAQVFNCVEINSSFYRAHLPSTYRRWSDSTPTAFRFAVKMPRSITHDARLRHTRAPVQQFLAEIEGLGKKLGPILIQLPPSMEYERRLASRFFVMLRELYQGAVVFEPRHKSWFEQHAEALLIDHRISRVAADPSISTTAAIPGGATQQLVYYRLHGSPRIYWSNYSQDRLLNWANAIQQRSGKVSSWVIFDNTAAGCATSNALQMRELAK